MGFYPWYYYVLCLIDCGLASIFAYLFIKDLMKGNRK